MKPTYNFPVLRGIQAGREYYLAMCPLKLVPKLFMYDEDGVPVELRAQRVLNKARIPEITKYIVEHPNEYIFSAITASIGGEVVFTPYSELGEEQNIGSLEIPMDAPMIINDGQHRRAAIEQAIKENADLADESIAVVFFIDAGLLKSQQMFADLNKHAVRPSQSLGVLYDHRDPLAELARTVMLSVPVFEQLTEKEKTTISNRSPKLFTLSSIYQATQALLRKGKRDNISKPEEKLAIRFWTTVALHIPEWELARKKQVSCALLRENYVHAHGIALQALGTAGADLIAEYPDIWQERIDLLRTINWSRSNTKVWEGRAMLQGKISKATQQVSLTSIYIKRAWNLEISEIEVQMEKQLIGDR